MTVNILALALWLDTFKEWNKRPASYASSARQHPHNAHLFREVSRPQFVSPLLRRLDTLLMVGQRTCLLHLSRSVKGIFSAIPILVPLEGCHFPKNALFVL